MSLHYSNTNTRANKVELDEGTTIDGKSVRFTVSLDMSYPEQSSALSHVWSHDNGWMPVARYAWQEWAAKDPGTTGLDKVGMALCELECRTVEILRS